MKSLQRICGLGALALLSACASMPKAQLTPVVAGDWSQRMQALLAISSFDLHGRIAASNANEAVSAGLHWQQMDSLSTIDLAGALGLGAAHIEQTDDDLLVTAANGVTLQGDAARSSLRGSLGFEPPLQSLRYWVLGTSDPDKPATQQMLDEQQRLTHVEQDGWAIDYQDYEQVGSQWLPKRLTLSRPPLKLRLVVNSWQL